MNTRQWTLPLVVIAATACASASTDASTSAKTVIQVEPDHIDGVYQTGKPATFHILVRRDGKPLRSGTLQCTLSVDNAPPFDQLRVEVAGGKAQVRRALDQPGVLRLTAQLQGARDALPAVGAAVFGPEAIRVSHPPPKDFWTFWDGERAQLAKVPFSPTISPSPEHSNAESAVFMVSLKLLDGGRVHGWLCRPKKRGRYPALLDLPSAGVYPPSPNTSCGFQRRIVFSMGVHDIEPDAPRAAYAKLESGPLSDYPRAGRQSRESYYYRRVFLGLLRSVELLAREPTWDGRNIFAVGSSQGGGLALVAAGLDPRVSAVVTQAPGLTDHRGILKDRPTGWPEMIQTRSDRAAIATAGYYDAAYFAERIQAPTLMVIGLRDQVCAPTTAYAAFNAIPAKGKSLVVEPTRGHDGAPDWLERVDKFLKRARRP